MNQILIKAAVLVFLLIPATGAYHYAQHIDGQGSRLVYVSELRESNSHEFSKAKIANAYDELEAAGDGDFDRALAVVETHMLQEMNLIEQKFVGNQSQRIPKIVPHDYRPEIFCLTLLASGLGMIPLFFVCNALDENSFTSRQRHESTRAQVALQVSLARRDTYIS